MRDFLCCFYNVLTDSPLYMHMAKISSLIAYFFSLTEIDSFIICGDFSFPEKDSDWRDYSSDDLLVEKFFIQQMYPVQ